MSLFSKQDVLGLVEKLGENVGRDLLTLAMQHEPRLREDPLPAADEEMHDARADALRRAGGKHDTDPTFPAVVPPPRESER